MRVFVAVEVTDAVREAVIRVLPSLQEVATQSRFVRPSKLHLTLQFLGEVEEGRVVEVAAALNEAVRGHAPFPLAYEGGGRFDDKVLWIGVTGAVDALKALQKSVQGALEPCGFPPEQRAYSPHLTLARSKSLRGDKAIKAAAERLKDFSAPPGEVTRVVLMQNIQNKDGGEYRVLHSASL